MSNTIIRVCLGVGLVVFGSVFGCASPVLSVDDSVRLGGQPVPMTAFVEAQSAWWLRRDVEDVPVRFLYGKTTIAEGKTNEHGFVALEAPLPDESADHFEAIAQVDEQSLRTIGRIFEWDPTRLIVAIDIDHTIADTDYEELFTHHSRFDPAPLPGAQETAMLLAEDFCIAYITARPRTLLEESRTWLHQHDFPAGPVITAPDIRTAIRSRRYKTRVLRALRQRWPNLLIGIGDKDADAQAYGINGMLTLIVKPRPEEYYGFHTLVFEDWHTLRAFIQNNRDLLTDRDALQAVINGERTVNYAITPWHRREDD